MNILQRTVLVHIFFFIIFYSFSISCTHHQVDVKAQNSEIHSAWNFIDELEKHVWSTEDIRKTRGIPIHEVRSSSGHLVWIYKDEDVEAQRWNFKFDDKTGKLLVATYFPKESEQSDFSPEFLKNKWSMFSCLRSEEHRTVKDSTRIYMKYQCGNKRFFLTEAGKTLSVTLYF